MDSSETGGGMADCSVGSIVWVRRRNGSWWPGKILGPDELSSSLITSPRSGTPVKLLGREDASVDWYNLEKSKRVKAFRCGEFDDCIEKAEAAQGMPPKKREKYARREDAIMHALELERQLLEKKYGKLGNSSNGRSRSSPDAVTSSIYLGNGSGNQNDSRLDQLSQKVDLSIAEKNRTNQNMYVKMVKEETQLSGDDDSAGVLPRMRGLQDFGLRTAPPREELSGVAFRAKRSRNAYLPYDSVEYLIDDQTLSSQLEIPVSKIDESSYQADMGENHISGSTEDTETDCSDTDSLESDSNDEMTAISDGSASIELQPKYPRRTEAPEEHASISSSDDFDELAFADSSSHPYLHGHVPTKSGVSKWQHKGKRNNRNLSNNSRGYTNSKSSNWSPSVPEHADRSFKNHTSRYGPKSSHSPYEFVDFEGSLGWNSRSAVRGYWDDSRDDFVGRHRFGCGGPTLIDVNLKVQANNYRRDVPIISLMSKLNGHAIVGHPIQIEALENGLTETYVSSTDYFVPSPTPLTSMWRTGRRTANSRVPRPFLPSMLNGEGKGREFANKGSNQKIRTLSSFASGKCQSDSRGGGLIKNGNTRTTVACIPVNLVFSRLHEELVGRHQ
ncbi:Tudor/PWWP/MBT superfamily protein [Striga hermonthica]|uniref:Tudor/PWWP/MBT superfamily protein n=1 Tax=Striga hermonthica TaxID=68872 RepID=A0A9N7R4F9_STRHE|nr:Tudor/PWWP/MBT superfamily protein [Striga hermonthica]